MSPVRGGQVRCRCPGEVSETMFRNLVTMVVVVLAMLCQAPLQADDHIEFNTDLRLRWEYSSPWDGLAGTAGDTATLMRTRVGMATSFSDNIDFSMTFLDARTLSGQNSPSLGDGEPSVREAYIQVADLGDLNEHLALIEGWSMGWGRKAVPTYDRGRVIHSADWSNLGPRTADGTHLHSEFLEGALDLNVHFLTLDKDSSNSAGSGDHFYGVHLGVDSLPFVEASFYYWKYSADNANQQAAAAAGFGDPGGSGEDTYGYFFSLREGIIPRVGLDFEYTLQDGDRYDATDNAIEKLDSLFFSLEGTYDIPGNDWGEGPVFHAGHMMATGTDAGATGQETYRSPFGSPHGTHGISDVVANSNVRDTYLGVTRRWYNTEVSVTYHILKADRGENWGNEFDVVLRKEQSADFLGGLMPLEVGLGKFSSDNSTLDSTNFFYVQTSWDF